MNPFCVPLILGTPSVATDTMLVVFISLAFKQFTTASQMSPLRVWPFSGINYIFSSCGPSKFTSLHNSAICSISLTSLDSSQAMENAGAELMSAIFWTADVFCHLNGPVLDGLCRERHISNFRNNFTFTFQVRK